MSGTPRWKGRYFSWDFGQSILKLHWIFSFNVAANEKLFIKRQTLFQCYFPEMYIFTVQTELHLTHRLPTWANNGRCVDDIWKTFKDIVLEVIERFVPHKILKPNPDPEYYNKEVKRLKLKVRRAYNRRKFGEYYQAELKRLSKKLLTAKRIAQETFLSSLLQN